TERSASDQRIRCRLTGVKVAGISRPIGGAAKLTGNGASAEAIDDRPAPTKGKPIARLCAADPRWARQRDQQFARFARSAAPVRRSRDVINCGPRVGTAAPQFYVIAEVTTIRTVGDRASLPPGALRLLRAVFGLTLFGPER